MAVTCNNSIKKNKDNKTVPLFGNSHESMQLITEILSHIHHCHMHADMYNTLPDSSPILQCVCNLVFHTGVFHIKKKS